LKFRLAHGQLRGYQMLAFSTSFTDYISSCGVGWTGL